MRSIRLVPAIIPFFLAISFGNPALAAVPSASVAPHIQSLLKPAVYNRVIQDSQIMTHASLDGKNYAYYAAMVVGASIRQTRTILTNYSLYSKMISYIDKATYDPKTQLLEISGGIFGWRLHSWVKFEQRGDNWIHYRIVRGHFTGMAGDILFEQVSQPGHPDRTLVYMGVGLTQEKWPPKFIIERGAEIVFGFTAKRMRSYITKETGNG